MNFKKIISVILTLSMITLTFSGAAFGQESNKINQNNTIKTVESFVIEKISDTQNEQGIYETEGFSKVNSITEVLVDPMGFPIETRIQVAEDVFNLSNEYIYSEVKEEKVINDFKTGKMRYKKSSKKYEQPLTLETNTSKISNTVLSDTQKINIESNLVSKIALLEESEFIEGEGFTAEQFLELKKMTKIALDKQQVNPQMSLLSTEMAGAFDNYYNHNTATGAFTVQALYFYEPSPQTYYHITGNTIGSTKNASSVASFKTYINAYEGYIIDDMEAATWPEVLGYASTISSLVILVVGWAAGPVGWVAIVLNYASALTAFIGLTSTAYGTYSRMQFSKNAQQQLINANSIVKVFPSNFENITLTMVDGY